MAVVRCPSMTRNLGSELSNSYSSLLGTRRPRSCNASSESLPTFMLQHNTNDTILNVDQMLFCCPVGDQCDFRKLTAAHIVQHANCIHKVPTIFFGTASAEISLPPKMPIDNAALILQLDEKLFWIKVVTNAT